MKITVTFDTEVQRDAEALAAAPQEILSGAMCGPSPGRLAR